jgi:hypothetical protein
MAAEKRASEEKSMDGKKIFLYTLGVGVLGGIGFLTYEHFKNKKEAQDSVENSQGSNVITTSKPVQGNDNFPLKFGSKGQRVVQLQEKLEKILGADRLKELTPIDGIWGSGTEKALKLAGLPTIIYKDSFDKIISGGSIASGMQSAIKMLTPSFMSGITQIKDIITLVPTFVVDGMGNRIPVKKNVILGAEIMVSNGMTKFKGIEGSVGSAPTRDVRYV